MNILVKYIGNDDKYWAKIKQRFINSYEELNLSFIQESVSANFNARSSFVETYNQSPQIIYIDMSVNSKELLYLTKLLNRNNEMRLTSIVGLFDYSGGWTEMKKAILASMRLLHYKSSEIHDVIYDPISLLNVDLAKNPHYVRGKEIDELVLEQVLRLSYIEDDKYHIETNSFIKEGSIIEIDNHPLENLTSSNRFFVKNFSQSNLYYNSRYAYDLEFTYIDSPFFEATQRSWILYKKYRNNPLGLKEDTGWDYEELIADVKKRKSIIRPMREGVRDWIKENSKKITPKRLKVLAIDKSLEIFSELNQQQGIFPYSLNIQTVLTKDYYQIERTMPALIVIKFDETNNEKTLGLIIDKIKSMNSYHPYILIFNHDSSTDKLRQAHDYQELLTYSGSVDLGIIKELGRKIDDKFKLSDNFNRVYLETSSVNSSITLRCDAKIVAMTESILYFESNDSVPMWTVFKARSPVNMLLTVVPHKEKSKFKSFGSGTKQVYRCLINGVGEKEKAKIRSLINKSLKVDDD